MVLYPNMQRPENNEFAPYYDGYVSLIEETDIISVLGRQLDEMRELERTIPEDRGNYAYAMGKWSVKELLVHLNDAERIFGYRAYRFAHNDPETLPGFDQDIYVANGRANERTLKNIFDEFELLRRANLMFFQRLTSDEWLRTGIASNAEVSVRAIAFITAGHVRHHLKILQERYLS